MGVGEWFSEFCGKLVVQNQDVISDRYRRLTKRLNQDFWDSESDTYHSLYVGSYGRDTAINGFSDLDILFQLPNSVFQKYNEYLGNGQSALLQAVRGSISKTYSTTLLRADGQIIQIPFSDGMTVELLPAFLEGDGSYTFADSNNGGSWKTCHPRAEIQAMAYRNKISNGNLRQLCRMIRRWKHVCRVSIKGLLIDTLAYQFIEDWQYKDKSYLYYDFMSRDFFLYLAEQSKDQEWWRAPGSGRYVWSAKAAFQYRARQAYNRAVEAISHQTKGQEWSARYEWRQLYGTAFPD